MKIISITDKFENYFDDIYKLCQTAQYDKIDSIKQNMATDSWHQNQHCLLYRIYIKKMFTGNGILNAVYDNDKIISISGAEMLDDNVCIWLKRMYTLPQYRNRKLHQMAIRPQYEWSMKNNYKIALTTWNVDHYYLYKWMKRKLKNKKHIYDCIPELKVENVKAYPSMLNVCSTPQWVVVHYLKDNYIWDIPEGLKIK